MSEPAAGNSKQQTVGAIAAVLAASVLLSRVLGFLRDVILANQVGAGSLADAYYAAFQIPDILNFLLSGGAFSLAFIPFYTQMRRSRGDAAADRLLATVLGSFGVLSIVAAALLFAYADALIALQFPHFEPERHELAVRLTRIVLPGQVFFITGGILRGALMANGRFLAHAFAPLGYNACIIAGGLLTGTVEGFAWGVLVGSFVGPFAFPLLDLVRSRGLRVRVAFLDADLRGYLMLALPIMLGASLGTVDEWYDKWFGGLQAAGTIAILSFARKLMLVPVAVVGQAVATAALPTLSRLFAEGRIAELNDTLLRTLAGSLSLSILAAAATWALSKPLVDFVYLHGAFSVEAAAQGAVLLGIMAFGIPGWITQQVAVRSFYARGEMWRPMLLGTAVALSAVPLYLGLGRRHGASGLALAGAIAMTVNATLTIGWVRLRHGGPALGALLAAGLRALPIAALAAAAAWGVRTGLVPLQPPVVQLGVAALAFAVVGVVGIQTVGDETLRALLRGVTSRLGALGSRRS